MDKGLTLTWTDLLIEDNTAEQFTEWIADWRRVVSGRVAPVFLNKFGAWFLRRPEGPVELLDVFTGEVAVLADSFEAFQAQVNEPSWQEVYLASKVVHQLHERGTIAGPGQCYAVVPHPAFGGPDPMLGKSIDPERVVVMDMRVWQSICAQSLWPSDRP
jgi:hypothetical protein